MSEIVGRAVVLCVVYLCGVLIRTLEVDDTLRGEDSQLYAIREGFRWPWWVVSSLPRWIGATALFFGRVARARKPDDDR